MIDMPIILQAIEEVESNGQWWLISKSGCVGLMQICPQWSRYNRKELLHPTINRMEGERMLAYWMRKSGNNLTKALAAYNCGYGGLSKKCGSGYAAKVIRVAKRLKTRADEET